MFCVSDSSRDVVIELATSSDRVVRRSQTAAWAFAAGTRCSDGAPVQRACTSVSLVTCHLLRVARPPINAIKVAHAYVLTHATHDKVTRPNCLPDEGLVDVDVTREVYDTADGIIDGIDDGSFDGGLSFLTAHSGYLIRPSFYRQFARKLETALADR